MFPIITLGDQITLTAKGSFGFKKQRPSRLLNPGGAIYISTMEDDYDKSKFDTSSAGDQVYTHYHQADYLTRALKSHGFEIVSMQRKGSPERDGVTTTDLFITAKI